MLIDGNDIHQLYTGLVCRQAGIHVDYVVDLSQVIKLFTTNNYQLVLIDVDVHKENGFLMAKQLRALDAHIPIIGISDACYSPSISKGFAYGMNYCTGRTHLLETLESKMKMSPIQDVA